MKNPETSSCEYLVVGAGPTGLALALFLARMGVQVRIVEGAPRRLPKTRAVGIHSRTIELLASAGLFSELEKNAHRVGRINVYAENGLLMQHRLSVTNSEYPYIFDIPQSSLEGILEDALQSHGVRVEYGRRLQDIHLQEDGGVVVHISRPEETGRSEEAVEILRPHFVFGCDGWKSRVRVAVSPEEHQLPNRHFLLADVRLNGELAEHIWHIHCNEAGGVFFFPMGGGLWRCVVELYARSDAPDPAKLREVLAHRVPPEVSLLDVQKCKLVSLKPVRATRFVQQGVFLLGDAAHVFPFNGNQGLNQGIQDAHNLAWKVFLYAEGFVSAAYLSSYDDERRRHARRMWNFSRGLERLTHLKVPGSRRMRDVLFSGLHAFHSTAESFVNRLESTDIDYGSKAAPSRVRGPAATVRDLLRPSNVPSPGSLVPDAKVLAQSPGAAPVRIRQLGSTGHFSLLLFVRASVSDRERQFCRDLLSWKGLPRWMERRVIAGRHLPPGIQAPAGELLLDPREIAHDRFSVTRIGVFLLRPDGILAYTYRPEHGSRVEDFSRWLKRFADWERVLLPL